MGARIRGSTAGRLKGGMAKVPKGFATMSPEKRREAALKGAATRKAKAAERQEAERLRRERILNNESEVIDGRKLA